MSDPEKNTDEEPKSRPSSLGRKVAFCVLVACFALALIVGRALWSSKAELELGRTAFEDNERTKAVVHLRQAAHWYTPGNPYVVEALDELRQIGRQAEMEGDADLALAAYRAIRTSCLGTRSFYIPHKQRLDEANQRIAALMAGQSPPPMDRGKTVEQLRAEHLEILQRVEQPHPFWSLIACLAFLLWVGAAFGFIFKSLDKDLHIKRPSSMVWGSLTIGGFTLWIIALIFA